MKKWLFNLSFIFLITFGIFVLNGCYPDDTLTTSQTDIVLTGYYDSVDFKTLSTYYMPDTVFPIREDTTDKDPVKDQDLILKTIADNMEAYGYERLYYSDTATQTPDVMIAVSAISITNVSVGWWYPYYPGWGWGWGWYKSGSRDADYWYGGWWGYYPPGYGWGVPYYSSYTTGTLLMEMTNPDDYRIIDNDTVVPIYWSGGVNGVLSSGSNSERIEKGIDQAFKQSDYLDNN